jgi:hypothetical protein
LDDFASKDERALCESARSELPALRERLECVGDEPIRHLELTLDQDTWDLRDGEVLELTCELEPALGRARILVASYVEGETWTADYGLVERPAGDFFSRTKARVDARLAWGGSEHALTAHLDGSELGEEPLALSVKLELPSLRRLFATNASISARTRRRGSEAVEVEPNSTALELRVAAKFTHDAVKSVTLWQSRRDRCERALLESPAFATCRTPLERSALLSVFRERPLREAARSRERRDRIAAAVEAGGELDRADRFAAARMLGVRGEVFALRRQSLRAADAFNGAAMLLLDRFDFGAATYAEFFELWRYLTRALGVLARAGHDDVFSHYVATTVRVSREMRQAHPEEPDYVRALAQALVLGAEAVDARSGGLHDAALDEAVELLAALAREKSWPWRSSELSRMRARAEALYERHHALRSDRLSAPPPRPK